MAEVTAVFKLTTMVPAMAGQNYLYIKKTYQVINIANW